MIARSETPGRQDRRGRQHVVCDQKVQHLQFSLGRHCIDCQHAFPQQHHLSGQRKRDALLRPQLSYPKNEPHLHGIDLRIPAGTTLAVVGHTGSGKSTLVQLVPRLLDPDAGVVTVDGVDVRRLDPEKLRRAIGFVPQETFLFSATIAENIAFGVESASDRITIPRSIRSCGLILHTIRKKAPIAESYGHER